MAKFERDSDKYDVLRYLIDIEKDADKAKTESEYIDIILDLIYTLQYIYDLDEFFHIEETKND